MRRRDLVRNLPDGFKTLRRRVEGDLMKRERVSSSYQSETTISPKQVNLLRQLAAGQSVRVF